MKKLLTIGICLVSQSVLPQELHDAVIARGVSQQREALDIIAEIDVADCLVDRPPIAIDRNEYSMVFAHSHVSFPISSSIEMRVERSRDSRVPDSAAALNPILVGLSVWAGQRFLDWIFDMRVERGPVYIPILLDGPGLLRVFIEVQGEATSPLCVIPIQVEN